MKHDSRHARESRKVALLVHLQPDAYVGITGNRARVGWSREPGRKAEKGWLGAHPVLHRVECRV